MMIVYIHDYDDGTDDDTDDDTEDDTNDDTDDRGRGHLYIPKNTRPNMIFRGDG